MESMSLLNMLAEVASEKLQTDPTVRMITKSEETKNVTNTISPDAECHHNQGKPMTLLQVSNISENNVLRLFTVSQANELKRKFYFTCRLLPQHCEETFQSFGSEEKARSLMKKHLKQHLISLLDEFKDTESREKYILRTVSTAKLSNGDSKSNGRKLKRVKADIKPKVSYEKENFKLHSRSLVDTSQSSDNIGSSTYNISSTSITDKQIQSFAPQNQAPVINDSTYYDAQNIAITNTHSSGVIDDYSSTSFTGNNAFSNQIETHNGNGDLTQLQVYESSYQYPEASKAFSSSTYDGNVMHNKFNVHVNGKNENASQTSVIDNNGIIYITPSTNQYLNCTTSGMYNGHVHDSNLENVSNESLKRNAESIPNVPSNQLSPKKMKTEIIDIKIGDSVKLEVLSPNQHVTENSFVEHDGTYFSNESNTNSSPETTTNYDEVKVEQELIDIWRDFTGGSIVIANTNNEFQMETRDISNITLESKETVKINSEEKQEVFGSLEVKKKGRLNGRGKFIGQSKNEKQMALNLIEKIKSQSPVQLESLECTICDPPRTFTAAATLLSHYKSHAGIRPYVCIYCEAVFTRQHSLNYHYLIHLNQTRFTCDECGRKFRHPSHFKEHLRRHTGESPYECMDCLMRFKTRNTYKRHLRTRHGKKLTTEGPVNSITDVSEEGEEQHEKEMESKVHKKNEKREGNEMFEEKIVIQNSFIDTTNSSSSSHTSIENNDSKWTNLVSIESNDRAVSHELSIQPVSEEEHFTDKIVQPKSTYHEMLPVEVLDFSNNTAMPSPAFKSTEVLYNQLYSEEEAILPSTSVMPENACERRQVHSNSFKSNVEFMYVVDKTISYSEIPHRVASSESTNYHAVECSQNLYSSTNTSNTGPLESALNRTVTNNLRNTGTPLPIQYQIGNENTSLEVTYNNISNSSNFASNSNQCDDMKHLATGSILGALLTSGSSRASVSSANPVRPFEPRSPDRCIKTNSDKWDTLMREVVSLSTMAKEKTNEREDATSSQLTVQGSNNVKPMKELSNNFRFDRFGNKDISEVYVLKYANGISGTRIAKVFKAKSHAINKEGVIERRKENANMMGRKPILITSSIGSCDEKNNVSIT